MDLVKAQQLADKLIRKHKLDVTALYLWDFVIDLFDPQDPTNKPSTYWLEKARDRQGQDARYVW